MGASQSSGNRNVEVQDELGEGYGGELRGKLCLSSPHLVGEQGLPASETLVRNIVRMLS